MGRIKFGISSFIVILSIFTMIGCASTGSTPSSTGSTPQSIPPDKLFSKIKMDMPQKQMLDLIGPETSMAHHSSYMLFIPIVGWFLPNSSETYYFYKDNGRVIVNQYGRISEIIYNPAESGYGEYVKWYE